MDIEGTFAKSLDGHIMRLTSVNRQLGIELPIAQRLMEQRARLVLHSRAPFDVARLIAWPWGNDAR